MGRMSLWSVLLIGILLVWGVASCRKPAEPNVVAEFKGGRLTVENLEAHRDLLRWQKSYRDNPESLTPEVVFEHSVNMEMIIAKGLKEKIHEDPRVRAQIHQFMSDLFLKIMKGTLITEIDRDQITEQDIRAYFDANQNHYRTPATYGLRILRHADPEFLDQLKKRIEAGEETFEAAVMAHSSDEETRRSGGLTGRRPLDRYRPEWRSAIEALNLNEVSAPVSFQDHAYLIQLVEKTEPGQQSFEERKSYVLNDLLYARYREQWRQVYENLRKEFDLNVYDHALEHFVGEEVRHAH